MSNPEAMTIQQEVDEAVASVIGPPRGRRRPSAARLLRRAVRPLAISIAIALPIAAWAYIANYQPLGEPIGGGIATAPPDADCATDHGSLSAPRTGERFRLIDIACPTGMSVTWAWTVGNNGPLPVEVQGIGIEGSDAFGFEFRPGGLPTQGIGRWETLSVMRPFRLDAGEAEAIATRLELTRCAPGSGHSFSQVNVTFKVLGIRRHDSVPMPWLARVSC